jgi:lysophospholipase L1-like esterase
MMNRLLIFAAITAALALIGSNLAQDKKKADPYEPVKDDPKLPRVLLIGDSISVGYTVPTRKLLAGKANVHRIPKNGESTDVGLKNIKAWLGEGKWDVIHFNWGLHDIKLGTGKHQVPIDEYEKNLREIVKTMKGTGATLIFATTTPVPEGKLSPPRKSEDVAAYNKVAKKVMDDNGVSINDLYAFALPQIEKIQLKANVHFNDKGSEVLAERVAAAIEKALKK